MMVSNGEDGRNKRFRTDMDGTYHSDRDSGIGNSELRHKREEPRENHILLITVLKPLYPITVDVLHTICSPSGPILRIVIFKKNGVQAMVEFGSVKTAQHAKEALNGADIYSGCCTLKIEYGKPTKLNVYKNDTESWDYTKENFDVPTEQRREPRKTLLTAPKEGFRAYSQNESASSYNADRFDRFDYGSNNATYSRPYSDNYRGDKLSPDAWPAEGNNVPSARSGFNNSGGFGNSAFMDDIHSSRGGYGNSSYMDNTGRGISRDSYPPRMGSRRNDSYSTEDKFSVTPSSGGVMMVYGLNAGKMNADKLFNLFCLYGNVLKVKFLKTKEGCAMVQLGDGLAVRNAMDNLNNCYFFTSKLQLGHSKQEFLSDVMNPYDLPDGTPSYKDFMGNRNNRFVNPAMAAKNRIQPPCNVLHFFNCPPTVTKEQLNEMFSEANVNLPETITIFPSKTERSTSGLLEFNSSSEAIEALVECNHTSIPNPSGKFPYTLKLCFSLMRNIPTKPRVPRESRIPTDDNSDEEFQ